MTPEPVPHIPPAGELLTGRVAEYGKLLDALAQRPGLLLLSADPWSGTSPMLRSALEDLDLPRVLVDARRCRDALDLAMAIADLAISTFAPEADAWWGNMRPPSDVAGLRLSRLLDAEGIDPQGLRLGDGPGLRRLREAFRLLMALTDQVVVAVDHIGPMLSALPERDAREVLGELRSIRQEFNQIDLVLVEYPEGPISAAFTDRDHPLYRAGARLRIRRAAPSRFVSDLAITRGWTKAPVDLIGASAELTSGVPVLVWEVIALAPPNPDLAASRAFAGWQELRRLTDANTSHAWELLRRVHPLAQPIISAMSVGMRPHAIDANSKSVNEALKRLREVGLAWRTERRSWALADPLLRAWARDHAPPWAIRRSNLASTAETVRRVG